jgi:Tfp pilus assembly PilM family ATPase
MNVTTLNISSGAIKYLAIKNGEAKHGSVKPQGTINNGSILQPEVLAGQLKSLFTENRLPRSGIICSLNGLPYSYRLFTLPKLAPEAFKEALLRMARKEMPVALEEMYLTWQVYPAENGEWQVLVTGIMRQPVDNLLKTLSAADIQPAYLDLQQLALTRLTKQKNAVIVELEKDYSNIVMVVNGVPAGMQIVPSFGPDADIRDDVRQVADRTGKMVEFYNGSHPRQPVADTVPILLTGGLAGDEDVLKLVQEASDYPVELLTCDEKILAGLRLHEYAANAGSALMPAVTGKDKDSGAGLHHYLDLGKINLETQTAKKQKINLLNLVIPLAVIVGIAVLVPSYLQKNSTRADIHKLQDNLTRVNTQYQQAQAAANNDKTSAISINATRAQAQTIAAGNQAILDAPNPADDIPLILGALPADVSYISLEIGPSGISITGEAVNAAAIVQFARNLENNSGYHKADITEMTYSATSAPEPLIHFTITVFK